MTRFFLFHLANVNYDDTGCTFQDPGKAGAVRLTNSLAYSLRAGIGPKIFGLSHG